MPGFNLEAEYAEFGIYFRVNTSPFYFDKIYNLDIYFTDEWTRARRWELEFS